MARAAASVACLLCLSAGVGASLSERLTRRAPMSWAPNRTAVFGDMTANRSEQPLGTIMFRVSDESSGAIFFQAVRWTTSGMTIPKTLIEEVCGSLSDQPNFTYSIYEKWGHGDNRSSAVGELCNETYTGGRWDPSAACSAASGNPACDVCGTKPNYACDPGTFDPKPDASGSFAYRFLNEHACELGDLSGMQGELESVPAVDCIDHDEKCPEWAAHHDCELHVEFMQLFCQASCDFCASGEANASGFVALRSLTVNSSAIAQMSVPFGVISEESVTTDLIGLNCDASGPPPVHQTNCGCLGYNGKRTPSVGTLTVFVPWSHETFHMAGPDLEQLSNRSIVVQCGPTFGEKAGAPLFCAALQ
mmetsp:Transcript_55638/g.161210  ORF Transcript_55638/g.161210 Transcript_55638/m.161210 type:complete len:362 (-) Transcript_55638:369-1454(-)|eukprot:CAMPEP_0176054326 /NCGR_PEP_ID=MMETSP0120_2-20121206/27029_1 /TAXON_ID=160619 /ORGANISM="Kryptoperidinium foliaceum, Strain CCMP 1326" /LENGTH=361 /DNA_ID=CAMNT_0017387791 /DNA_START=55 /DNA_END=1140 /DNA_ORIENTATION=-